MQKWEYLYVILRWYGFWVKRVVCEQYRPITFSDIIITKSDRSVGVYVRETLFFSGQNQIID